MGAYKDLTEQRFGRWLVVKYSGKDKHGASMWECLCDCGKKMIIRGSGLLSGVSKSCGCYKREVTSKLFFKDRTGQRFGRLIVLKKTCKDKWGTYKWLCKCDCGKTKIVVSSSLIKGETKSCGCLFREMSGKRLGEMASKQCGENSPKWQGGISFEPYCADWKSKEYKEYILERDGHKCLNPMCPKTNNKLCRHHIDYDKKNCIPENVITVCLSCNAIANSNRKWHTSWYQAILHNRYGYVY